MTTETSSISAEVTALRPDKGVHPILEQDHEYIFIDACMQAWPDADYGNSHRHGVTAYGVTAFRPHDGVEDALEGLMFWHLIAQKYPNTLVARSAADVRRAKAEQRVALVLSAQGGEWIGNKLHRIEAFARLGLRVMLPSYNTTNLICGGCLDGVDGGLTKFGELVVEECNRVGILLDATHIGRRSSLEMIDRSSQPVVFTHSNPSALVPNPRNIDDEQIRNCATRGGVIGLAPWGPLVLKPGTTAWPTMDDFIDHIDHVADLTGSTDHIGIGTDMSIGTYPDHSHDPWGDAVTFAGVTGEYERHLSSDVRSPGRALRDFNSYAQVGKFAERLLERGYSSQDVHKFLGENFLRVYEQVWKE